MSAFVTDQFRILNAGSFVESISNNSYYAFLGLSNPTATGFGRTDNWDTSDSINLLKRICKNLDKNFNNEIKVLKSLIRGENHKSHNCKGKDLYNFSWNKNVNKENNMVA